MTKFLSETMIGIMAIFFALFTMFMFTVVACGTLKDIGRTVNDAATILCELVATDNKDQLDGLSPAEWCAIQKNIAPFIDEILSAKQSASKKSGLNK